ncbi:MAG TPA: hypothetical protein VKT82_28735 [Ktedonobacterales bacterium]|nr:hypothetical protein [Ktedonobacterales bacterium]
MRFMRLPILMVVIALAASLSTQFEYLLRFGAMALAALTILGALSDIQRAARNANGMPREDLLKLWFGNKLREQHTWEALTAQVTETASALRLPSPALPALPPPNPSANGARSRSSIRPFSSAGKSHSANRTSADIEAADNQTSPTPARSAWGPLLRLLAIEAASEAIVIAAIVLNWLLPAPGTSSGEQIALLILGLLALGLLFYDWRLLRRFVAAVQAEIARHTPQTSTRATSSS